MKYFILILIRAYWKFIPETNRRSCLFAESCSRYVFRITTEQGFVAGVNAFYKRYRQCRPGYQIKASTDSNEIEMVLIDGTVIEKKDIAENLLI